MQTLYTDTIRLFTPIVIILWCNSFVSNATEAECGRADGFSDVNYILFVWHIL